MTQPSKAGKESGMKAKRTLIGTSFEDGPFGKDRNKWVTCKYRYAKLTGLELIEKIDA
jgi:hypothetical protein